MDFYSDYLEKARDLANSVYDQGVKALSKTETERRLAEALSHANWGASTTLMGEIAQATNDLSEFQVIMREIWAACASTGRNWRVAYKGLALLEFLLKNGHKRVIEEAKENRSKIRRLEVFSYLRDGVEKGNGVREKAKAVTELLDDDDYLKRERAEAAKLRAKFTGVGRDGQQSAMMSGGGGYDDYGDDNKIGSDQSDDEEEARRRSKKKSSKKKSSKRSSDEEEDEDEKPKSKSKKKHADDDDDDFAPSFSKKSESKSSKKKPVNDDDDDDFGFSESKSSKKKSDDDDDFGFSDDDSKKKSTKTSTSQFKAGPIGTISVKIPGAGGSSNSSSSSTNATTLSAATSKKKDDDVDLLQGFDPFGAAESAAGPAKPTITSAPSQQSTTTANILDMFNAPPTSAPSAGFGGFPAMNAPAATPGAFPSMSMGGGPQMGGMFGASQPIGHQPMMMVPPMGQQPMMMPQMGQQPMMMAPPMGQQPMMMGQQPMMMSGGQQSMGGMVQPMTGMGFPSMSQQPMMGGAARPANSPPQQQQQSKKDAFSGLMNFPLSSTSGAGKPPSQSLI